MKAKGLNLLIALLSLCMTSCLELFETDKKGTLVISFPQEFKLESKSGSITDPNNFILSVCNSKGEQIYRGEFGYAPDQMLVDPGTYTISAVSCEFNEPEFECPQYGDNQVVKVSSGKTTNVVLSCYQLNSGIRLKIDSSFLNEYPNGILFLKSSQGRLMYGYNENRIAYFKPGSVSLILSNDNKESSLLSKNLIAQQILTLSISASQESSLQSGSGISISVDTSRTWISDNYYIGGSNKGDESESALTITQAKSKTGSSDVWVYGYIVGGDLSSSNCSFCAPFNSRTNMVIASKATCKDKGSCMSVQLSKGDIRDELNLVDHQEYLGKQIYLKGDIVESYYGIPGIQNISEYKWK